MDGTEKVFGLPGICQLVICLLACWPLLAQSQPNLKPPHSLLVEHVTVIDSTGSAPHPNIAVLIEDGKIKAISRSGQSNADDGTLIVDARGSS
jgi:hypothetical protein